MISRPTLRGSFGMVSSTHWLASASAMAELEAGGTAFDAAAAGAFVLHVVEPHLNGPGGEVPAVFTTARNPEPVVLCGQGPAPAGATREHYLGLGLGLIPGSGPIAATIPGAVDAWLLLARDHGTRSVRQVLSYAIGYARRGHPLLPQAAAAIASAEQLFREHWPTSAALWLPGGRVPQAWQLMVNEDYAAVLERLVTAAESAGPSRDAQFDAARAAWSQGFAAEALGRFQALPHLDASGRAHPGLVTAQDIAGWSASYEPPVIHPFRQFQIAKTGLWGQGPVLLQSLAMLAELPDEALDPSDADGAHVITEVLKLAFADREAWYGDGPTVPVTALLDPAYTRSRLELTGPHSSLLLRPGAPGGRQPRLPRHVQLSPHPPGAAGLGEPTMTTTAITTTAITTAITAPGQVRGDTCHIDVADQWGNLISATPSGGWLQSSPTVPGLGFCLGTRMQMFWLDDGLPATVAPGRRPRTTLSPTLVLRDGEPYLACGTPGGDQQDQWQLLFLLRHLVHGLDLQAAIDAPALHTTALPSSFYPRTMDAAGLVAEDRLGDAVLDALTARGHHVTRAGPWSLGRLCAVSRDPSGLLSAAANPRGAQGYACGR